MDMMGITVYVVKSKGEVSFLHDTAFAKPLLHLEYNAEKRELLFVFEDHSQMPFGEPVKKEIGEYLLSVEKASFFQMDMKTQKPVGGFSVPIKTVTYI